MDRSASARSNSEDPLPDIAVAMIASAGLRDFVLNTVGSMRSCGVRPEQMFLFYSDAAAGEYAALAKLLPQGNMVPIHAALDPPLVDAEETYSNYGTDYFSRFTSIKLLALRWLMARGIRQVVYTDVDIVWIRNPLGYLKRVAKRHDFAAQNESTELLTPTLCAGFMSLKNTPRIKQLVSALVDLHEQAIAAGRNLHDQQIINEYIQQNPKLHRAVWLLPAAQFPNGLFASMFTTPDCLQTFPLSILRPMIFHANWCVGLSAKQAMLEKSGLWRPGGWPIPG